MLFEATVEEIAGGAIVGELIAVEEKIVHVVGKDELLDGYTASAQAGDEVDRLGEVDAAVVIAVDEKDRRFPGVDRSDRRRLVSELGQLRWNIFAIPIVGGPVVNAVEVHAGSENIGVARQTHGGEESAVTATPQAHPPRVHTRPPLKIFSAATDFPLFL